MATSACVTSQVLIGSPHLAVTPDQVQLYLEAPARAFQKIAVIDTSSKYSFALTAQAKSDVVIRRLAKSAAELGANGIWLQGIRDGKAVQFDAGVGTQSYSAHGDVSLSLGGSGLFAAKYGRAIAIYAEPVGASAAR